MGMLKDIWNYRGFILGSVKREFQLKYRNSLLGAAWTVLNPLAMILVYTVIFSGVMKARMPGVGGAFGYSVYLCAGILVWNLFTEIINKSQTMFLENANLLKKISFPRVCLPAIVVASSALNFSIVFIIFTIFLIILGDFPGWVFLAMIPLVGLVVFLALGIGVTLGVLNVFFRDVGQFFGIFLTFWFWLTPIVYLPSILPDSFQRFMVFNPMAESIAAVQGVAVLGVWPHWTSLIYPLFLATLIYIVALYLLRSRMSEIMDEL